MSLEKLPTKELEKKVVEAKKTFEATIKKPKTVVTTILLLLSFSVFAQCPIDFHTNKVSVETWVRMKRLHEDMVVGVIKVIGVYNDFYLVKVQSSKIEFYAVNYKWNDFKLIQPLVIPKYYTIQSYETELMKNYSNVSNCK